MDFVGSVLASPFICIGWIIVGAVAGALARQIMGGRDKPFINDLILGLIGAFVGGLVASLLNFNRPEGGIGAVAVSLVIAVIGSIIIIFIGRMVLRRT
jgi:uncharacterized membrane protein YeaQ/YmgE (transglycosylase-associated protein family)